MIRAESVVAVAIRVPLAPVPSLLESPEFHFQLKGALPGAAAQGQRQPAAARAGRRVGVRVPRSTLAPRACTHAHARTRATAQGGAVGAPACSAKRRPKAATPTRREWPKKKGGRWVFPRAARGADGMCKRVPACEHGDVPLQRGQEPHARPAADFNPEVNPEASITARGALRGAAVRLNACPQPSPASPCDRARFWLAHAHAAAAPTGTVFAVTLRRCFFCH